jgi:hypothetical protein
MTALPKPVEEFCGRQLARVVPDEITAMAEVLRARHPGAVAILAYGSCLRGAEIADTLIDFYVLVESLCGVSGNFLSRLACAVAPPNVYYAEALVSGKQLRAKYACLPLSVFAKQMKRENGNPYFWARFSQPSALIYARDLSARTATVAAVAQALRTSFANAKPLTPDKDPLAIWTAGFSETYRTELRAEKTGRAAHIVAAYPEYYTQAASLLASEPSIHANLAARRITGKLWSVLRLLKAAFTFQGGADYIVWKIERHSGEKIALTPWQRRHPIVAGLILLPTLLRKGAVR